MFLRLRCRTDATLKSLEIIPSLFKETQLINCVYLRNQSFNLNDEMFDTFRATMYICVIKMWNKTIHHIMYLNRQNKKKKEKRNEIIQFCRKKEQKEY